MCPYYQEPKISSSRPSLFNAISVLWAQHDSTNFITFTLPSLVGKTYQRSANCPDTGDGVITEKFSKVLEAWKLREKRAGRKLSYAWVSEAQMERQEKFGGIGDIHFHLITNKCYKTGRGKFQKFINDAAYKDFQWLQSLWCSHVGVSANNCIDVENIPQGINSIPAYMAKYMGKGSPRRIESRKFFATRDLSRYRQIQLSRFPDDIEIVRSVVHKMDGFEVTCHYLDTRTVLELYGSHMIEAGTLTGTTGGKHFTPEAIADRQASRIHMQALSELKTEERQESKEPVSYEGASAFTRALIKKVSALSGTKSP